jgi:hypothetical protein
MLVGFPKNFLCEFMKKAQRSYIPFPPMLSAILNNFTHFFLKALLFERLRDHEEQFLVLELSVVSVFVRKLLDELHVKLEPSD